MCLTRVRVCIAALEEKVLIFSTAPVCCTRMRQAIEVKRTLCEWALTHLCYL